jgi:hypothetical protein
MMKKSSKTTRSRVARVTKRRRKHEVPNGEEFVDQEERIFREATKHLVFDHGMFLVATGLCEARVKELRVWIIAVTLRYTTGHEGYIGDLLDDGKDFTFLTPPEVRKERARQIAADPARMRLNASRRSSTSERRSGTQPSTVCGGFSPKGSSPSPTSIAPFLSCKLGSERGIPYRSPSCGQAVRFPAGLAPEFFPVHRNIGRRGNPQPDAVALHRNDSNHDIRVGQQDSFTNLATENKHQIPP